MIPPQMSGRISSVNNHSQCHTRPRGIGCWKWGKGRSKPEHGLEHEKRREQTTGKKVITRVLGFAWSLNTVYVPHTPKERSESGAVEWRIIQRSWNGVTRSLGEARRIRLLIQVLIFLAGCSGWTHKMIGPMGKHVSTPAAQSSYRIPLATDMKFMRSSSVVIHPVSSRVYPPWQVVFLSHRLNEHIFRLGS